MNKTDSQPPTDNDNASLRSKVAGGADWERERRDNRILENGINTAEDNAITPSETATQSKSKFAENYPDKKKGYDNQNKFGFDSNAKGFGHDYPKPEGHPYDYEETDKKKDADVPPPDEKWAGNPYEPARTLKPKEK